MGRKFPRFEDHKNVVCFNCKEQISKVKPVDTGYPDGFGRFAQLCDCGWATYYDIKMPGSPLPGNWYDWTIQLWNTNPKEFGQGYRASLYYDGDVDMVQNPYAKDTYEFAAWNRGWNDHYDRNWHRKDEENATV